VDFLHRNTLSLIVILGFLAPHAVGQQVVTKVPILTPEQREILSHMSIVYLDDGQGGTVKTIEISGVNIRLVSGAGATNGYPTNPDSLDPADTQTNGLGNLIVGYNELGNPSGDDRTGSHNIVFGHGNSFTSFGGVVGPHDNTVSGPFASVTGGKRNAASSSGASISGGWYGTASGPYSSISGGYSNSATTFSASVSGGRNNLASGRHASVSGGFGNVASGVYSSVNAGIYNTAFGSSSSVSGGYGNIASGYYSSVSGGTDNTASGPRSSVSGGQDNIGFGLAASVSGGLSRGSLTSYDWRGGSYSSDD
jgi:hypothetical protein